MNTLDIKNLKFHYTHKDNVQKIMKEQKLKAHFGVYAFDNVNDLVTFTYTNYRIGYTNLYDTRIIAFTTDEKFEEGSDHNKRFYKNARTIVCAKNEVPIKVKFVVSLEVLFKHIGLPLLGDEVKK